MVSLEVDERVRGHAPMPYGSQPKNLQYGKASILFGIALPGSANECVERVVDLGSLPVECISTVHSG